MSEAARYYGLAYDALDESLPDAGLRRAFEDSLDACTLRPAFAFLKNGVKSIEAEVRCMCARVSLGKLF